MARDVAKVVEVRMRAEARFTVLKAFMRRGSVVSDLQVRGLCGCNMYFVVEKGGGGNNVHG